MKRRDKETSISEVDLMKAAGSRLDNALEVWERYMALRKIGGSAKITWSDASGYRLYEGRGE